MKTTSKANQLLEKKPCLPNVTSVWAIMRMARKIVWANLVPYIGFTLIKIRASNNHLNRYFKVPGHISIEFCRGARDLDEVVSNIGFE